MAKEQQNPQQQPEQQAQQCEQQQPRSLAAKLARVLAQVGGIPKDCKNKEQGYMYRSENAIMERLRELLAAETVILIPDEEEVTILEPYTTSRGNKMNRTKCRMAFTFLDGDTGEILGPYHMSGIGMDSMDKDLPKAQTMATKYFLAKAFLISDAGGRMDAEGDAETDRAAKETQATVTAAKAATSTVTQAAQAAAAQVIAPDQVAIVRDLIKEAQMDAAKVLQFAGATKVEEINLTMYAKVIKKLQATIAAAKTAAQ